MDQKKNWELRKKPTGRFRIGGGRKWGSLQPSVKAKGGGGIKHVQEGGQDLRRRAIIPYIGLRGGGGKKISGPGGFNPDGQELRGSTQEEKKGGVSRTKGAGDELIPRETRQQEKICGGAKETFGGKRKKKN